MTYSTYKQYRRITNMPYEDFKRLVTFAEDWKNYYGKYPNLPYQWRGELKAAERLGIDVNGGDDV
mgnify:CR=1 FL=1